MIVTLIAAIARNRVIGNEGKLPWHLPVDLRYFKAATMGHHIVMGRQTWDSLPNGALPGRKNVVISRSTKMDFEDAMLFPSLEIALEKIYRAGESEAFLIGGAQIFASGIQFADKLMITEVDAAPDGDVLFPEWRTADWTEISREHHAADEKNMFNVDFVVFEKVKKRKDALMSWRGFDY